MKNSRKSTVQVAVALQTGINVSASLDSNPPSPFFIRPVPADCSPNAEEPSPEEEQLRAFLQRQLPSLHASPELSKRIQGALRDFKR